MFNLTRNFPPGVGSKLGEYVYALLDPRDKKIFYIGKGNGDRLFDHFVEAEHDQLSNAGSTQKLKRILDIWDDELDVEWVIVRHNLQNLPVDAFDVEAALIDILEISQNGPALNDIAGHRNASRGMLSEETVRGFAAESVNPNESFPAVFVFPVQKALASGVDIYNATRSSWIVSSFAKCLVSPLAVGISNGISEGVFEIAEWNPHPSSGKWEFTGRDITNGHSLAKVNWAPVIGAAMGYWQYGNYLIVEFNGAGQFRFLRGSKNMNWQELYVK